MDLTRAALLIDGDNISARYNATLKHEAEKLGRLDVMRVYGGPCVSAEWLNTPGARFIQAGDGKNAADLLLSIDAMELALSGGIQAFAVASSDGDLTHLAHRLREKGFYLLGLGDNRAPERFRQACHVFHHLPEQKTCAQKSTDAAKSQSDKAPTPFDAKIRKIIAANSTNGEGIAIPELSRQMKRDHDTKISTYPERSWRRYLAARTALYDLDPKGPEAKVRFLPNGFAST